MEEANDMIYSGCSYGTGGIDNTPREMGWQMLEVEEEKNSIVKLLAPHLQCSGVALAT